MSMLAPRRRAVDLADALHSALVGVLAPDGKCHGCGEHRRLEIDHVDGRTWRARAVSRLQRAKRYWNEYLAGVRLRALCRSCNAVDGGGRRYDRKEAA